MNFFTSFTCYTEGAGEYMARAHAGKCRPSNIDFGLSYLLRFRKGIVLISNIYGDHKTVTCKNPLISSAACISDTVVYNPSQGH